MSSVGIILTNEKRPKVEHVVHFSFLTMNNVTKYEVLQAGIRITTTIDIKKKKIHTDSQLIVGQIKASFTSKEGNMMK